MCFADTSSPSILQWPALSRKFPWGVTLLLGGGFALAEATKVVVVPVVVVVVVVKVAVVVVVVVAAVTSILQWPALSRKFPWGVTLLLGG